MKVAVLAPGRAKCVEPTALTFKGHLVRGSPARRDPEHEYPALALRPMPAAPGCPGAARGHRTRVSPFSFFWPCLKAHGILIP